MGEVVRSACTARANKLLVRVYTADDYADRWSSAFGWTAPASEAEPTHVEELCADMRRRHVSARKLAAALSVDHSFLSKVLRGEKPCPPGLATRDLESLKASVPSKRKAANARSSRKGGVDRK